MRDLQSIISENEAAEQSWEARWRRLRREITDLLAYTQELRKAAGLQQALTIMDNIEKNDAPSR